MMTYQEANLLFLKKYNNRNNEPKIVFPYNLHYKNDYFIEIELPTMLFKSQETDVNLINKYVEVLKNNDMPNCWTTYGKKTKNGSIYPFWHGLFYILDGNHRYEAKKYLGYKKIKTFLPKSDYDLYLELVND